MNFMEQLRKYRGSLEYKRFKWWKKRQYKRFFNNDNFEYDSVSIIRFLILKLTVMGIYYAKYGICVDHKKQAHQIWETRKYFKNYLDGEDWAYEQCQKKFTEQFGCIYDIEMVVKPYDDKHSTVDFICISNVKDREEAERVWNSYDVLGMARERILEYRKKAFETMERHIDSWWD